MTPSRFVMRAVAGIMRRGGAVLSRAADYAYVHSDPKPPRQTEAILQRNARFRDAHAGQRCFVIGNGPSLLGQDLSPLGNEITFAMSGFWKNEAVERWQPTYYCFADRIYYDGSQQVDQFFRSIRERVHSSNFFFPLNGKEIFDRQKLLPTESTYFVSFRSQPFGLSSADSVDITIPVPFVFSTAQLAIMAAIYMRCSPIYLLGLDHDWLGHRTQDRHFYGGQTIDNHATATGELNAPYDHDVLHVWKLWQGYRKLKTIAHSRGVEIFNATDGGLLDVFERVSFESLI